ncbi:hypothetical protein D9Q98_009708 [Chlorella vulgaris]|uniref:F-box domain-containing protein n=1 Tax=Chlorella vulgaris TaxID=3077 RepID=A0A9D4YS81_CHLVU|nr:hypothetical protein D9Q98_009708 [Chlorella vulgaris]
MNTSLPIDLLAVIFCHPLSVADLSSAAQVCRTWRAAVAREAPWRAAWQRDCPEADTATIAALSQLDAPPGGTGRQVYRALTQAWTCDYCQQQFTDGANSRGSSCSYHPGILFSGGRLNGTGLRYTCCSRRAHHIPNGSRDNNGCAATFHVGGNSAWQRHGTAVKPRRDARTAAGIAAPSTSLGSASCPMNSDLGQHPSNGVERSALRGSAWLQEWHPNHRPGVLELPSRLLASMAAGT